ncbi:MAG: hypothetical protein RIQ46_1261 [Pseudomonadota bacterium]|jgi:hypothetical protein
MALGILITFLCGMANFGLHKAVLECGHPLVRQMPWLFGPLGGRFSLVFEFVLLLGAMLLAGEGMFGWALAYAGYTALNGVSAWLILTGRI